MVPVFCFACFSGYSNHLQLLMTITLRKLIPIAFRIGILNRQLVVLEVLKVTLIVLSLGSILTRPCYMTVIPSSLLKPLIVHPLK